MLELAQAIYHTHFQAMEAEARAAQGADMKLKLERQELDRLLWNTVKERDALQIRVDAAERALNTARTDAQTARADSRELINENAQLLQHTKSSIDGALHDAGARVDALVRTMRIELRTIVTDARLSGDLVHQLMQLVQRLIIDAKCIYTGIPTASAAAAAQQQHEKTNQ